MGFLDRAKAAADELAARADTALGGAGLGGPASPSAGADAARYLHDLGVLAYLDATGRPAAGAERERVLEALRDLEARGAVGSLALHAAAPPAPGMGGRTPTAPGTGTPTAPRGGSPPPAAAPAPPPPERPVTPPPPPSWMQGEDTSA